MEKKRPELDGSGIGYSDLGFIRCLSVQLDNHSVMVSYCCYCFTVLGGQHSQTSGQVSQKSSSLSFLNTGPVNSSPNPSPFVLLWCYRQPLELSRLEISELTTIEIANACRGAAEEVIRLMFRVSAEGEWYLFLQVVAGLLFLSYVGTFTDLITLVYIGRYIIHVCR